MKAPIQYVEVYPLRVFVVQFAGDVAQCSSLPAWFAAGRTANIVAPITESALFDRISHDSHLGDFPQALRLSAISQMIAFFLDLLSYTKFGVNARPH